MTPARRDRVFTARRSRRAIYVMRDNADPLDLSKGILEHRAFPADRFRVDPPALAIVLPARRARED